MWGWFGSGPKPEGDNSASTANADDTSANANSSSSSSNNNNNNNPDSSVFGGAFSFMKGILGMDQLKVEEVEGENKADVVDEGKRKGLFSQLSNYIGKDVTSMISLPVWVFEPVSFLQIMAEPLQYENLLQLVSNLLLLISYNFFQCLIK
jgi:hypothetical protein